MDRLCDTCGLPLAPQSGRGGRRKRHPECSPRAKGKPAAVAVESAAERPGSTREAVVGEVESLGAWDKPESLAALTLAEMIDARSEQGAAHAALVRELRTTLAELRRNAAPVKRGLFDQLAEKRAENERAARGA